MSYCSASAVRFPFIKALIAGIVKKGYKKLSLVIDGTDLGKSCGALMISLAIGKRALPLVWLVKKGTKGHFSVDEHLALLTQVKELLPEDVLITLLGDGEFDAWQLQEYAIEQGWSYALRTAKNTLIEDSKSDSYAVGELVADPKTGYLFLTNCAIGKKKYGSVNVLVWHEKKHKQPLYLLSNLEWVKDIMKYYRKRWSIETLFADIKSRGFNIHKTRISNPQMLYNLLIIVCIAFCFCVITGKAKYLFKGLLAKVIDKNKIHNYSVFTLGKRILKEIFGQNLSFAHYFSKIWLLFFCVRL